MQWERAVLMGVLASLVNDGAVAAEPCPERARYLHDLAMQEPASVHISGRETLATRHQNGQTGVIYTRNITRRSMVRMSKAMVMDGSAVPESGIHTQQVSCSENRDL